MKFIKPEALEEIKKIKCSKRIIIKHYSESSIWIKSERSYVSIWTPFSKDMVRVEINWSCVGSVMIEEAKDFYKDFQEIIKIAEQAKKILIKYGQYGEEK